MNAMNAINAATNLLRQQVAVDKVCKVLGVKIFTTTEIAFLARNAGFHALFIDLEHSALSLANANVLCVAAMSVGVSPFIRLPGKASAGFVQRVLDNGAQGVIFPHVDRPEQAREAVQMSKFPPLGKRSVTGMQPHMGYQSVPIPKTVEVGNRELSTVVVMVESPESVDNIDEIAGTEGVDVVLIGTNDLSIEQGYPGDFDHPEFQTAIEKVATAVKKHGKVLGVAGIYNRSDILTTFIHQHKARFIVGHVDLPLLAAATANVGKELDLIEGTK